VPLIIPSTGSLKPATHAAVRERPRSKALAQVASTSTTPTTRSIRDAHRCPTLPSVESADMKP
jgi:hypothetical protein